eukprot:TRINITY_DN4137_c0_g1_i17.p1 TRINITY_DN4137_c0_g1~~TRINITY_DN4137_c0_g1_i17.p1  ORF type:complete len:383 (-),score=30.59 TRINITY_DN4137_c0_g1_i17:523-1638(-)
MTVQKLLEVDKHEAQRLRKYLETHNVYDSSQKILIKNSSARIPIKSESDEDQLKEDISKNFGYSVQILVEETRGEKLNSPKNKLDLLKKRVSEQCGDVKDLPESYEIYGDLILIPSNSLLAESEQKEEVYDIICDIFRVNRIARKNAVVNDKFRSPRTDLLRGAEPWVHIVENRIRYNFDVTKSMFCRGNITEKMRVAKFDCSTEVVVDLFAGIGYFVLPYLVHANARHVYACEWNPNSVEALKVNLEDAGVADRCTVLLGDNREVAPSNVADRVNLGLIPSSEISWKTGVCALKPSGGVLHIHSNVEVKSNQTKQESFATTGQHILHCIQTLVKEHKEGDYCCEIVHTECVKSYAPRIYHVVFDLKISQK